MFEWHRISIEEQNKAEFFRLQGDDRLVSALKRRAAIDESNYLVDQTKYISTL